MSSLGPARDVFLYLIYRLHASHNRLDTSWHDHEYFRRPPRLGFRQTKQRAVKIADQNRENSKLHRLPNELLQQIADHPDGADLMSFHSTSRRMRGGLLPVVQHQPPITQVDRTLFMARLYISRYARMVDVQRTWPVTGRRPTTVLCGFCLQSHPRHAFNAANLARGPYCRACRRARGIFQICPHKTLTFLQLRSVLGYSLSVGLCTNVDHPPTAPPDPPPPPLNLQPGMPIVGAYVARASGIRFFGSHPISHEYLKPKVVRKHLGDDLRTRRGFIVSEKLRAPRIFYKWLGAATERHIRCRIVEILVGMDEYICPHLRTSSLELWHTKARIERVSHGEFALNDSFDISPKQDRWCFAQCGEPDCNTRIGYANVRPRGFYSGQSVTVFQIWRRIGPLEDVRNPQ
jgi:hypothetical protein